MLINITFSVLNQTTIFPESKPSAANEYTASLAVSKQIKKINNVELNILATLAV